MTGARLAGWLRKPWVVTALVGVAIIVLAWTAWAPIRVESREQRFEIPKGTWARRMAGDKVEILPAEIRLTLGVKDMLVLKNLDDVPQVFGSILLMPGQSFRLPFEKAASYQFSCTAHLSGQMSIVVEPNPISAWERVRWRAGTLLRAGQWRDSRWR
jgi:hypothetical protein